MGRFWTSSEILGRVLNFSFTAKKKKKIHLRLSKEQGLLVPETFWCDLAAG